MHTAPGMARFENDVKTYGTQAASSVFVMLSRFENDVKTYGTQAVPPLAYPLLGFENDVKTYGTQASMQFTTETVCLRMM